MELKVFVSSTREDLNADCRPKVLDAVKYSGAVAVVMEDWHTGYVPAPDLVREKLNGSTHYLGVFAYRRGWTAPGDSVSITESEFEIACMRLRPESMAVYVPQEGTAFAATLRERAAVQTPDDEEAQRCFRSRVLSQGVAEPFQDVADLSMRVLRRVVLWNRPLLENELEKAPPRGLAPHPDEVAELGRADAVHCFVTQVLPRGGGAGTPNAAGVLVSGPPAYGQAQLLMRLRRHFERHTFRPPRPVTVGCGPLWSTGGVGSLLRALAREMSIPEPAGPAALAVTLGELLKTSDVVLEVTQLQNFEDGVPGFAKAFWRPLLDALPVATPYRLLCLATHEGAAPAAAGWEGVVQRCGPPAAAPDPRLFLHLPELGPFTEAELSVFAGGYLPPEQVQPFVKAMMTHTAGVPSHLYTLLATPSTWQT
jgi:hypothetical protein